MHLVICVSLPESGLVSSYNYITSTFFHINYTLILGNDQLDALFLNVFILCLYMFRAASAHHLEVQIVLIRHLV
jgi:hypothetical protein